MPLILVAKSRKMLLFERQKVKNLKKIKRRLMLLITTMRRVTRITRARKIKKQRITTFLVRGSTRKTAKREQE